MSSPAHFSPPWPSRPGMCRPPHGHCRGSGVRLPRFEGRFDGRRRAAAAAAERSGPARFESGVRQPAGFEAVNSTRCELTCPAWHEDRPGWRGPSSINVAARHSAAHSLGGAIAEGRIVREGASSPGPGPNVLKRSRALIRVSQVNNVAELFQGVLSFPGFPGVQALQSAPPGEIEQGWEESR